MTFIDELMKHYLQLEEREPPQDAGGHPSSGVHERVGEEWAAWDRQMSAFQAIISARLFADATTRARSDRNRQREAIERLRDQLADRAPERGQA